MPPVQPAAAGVVAVIPARYDSTRFPGKPLAPIAGKPMLQHVWERTARAGSVQKVLVATDDLRIAEAVTAWGGEALMTRREHRSGTERLAEVASREEAAIFVNVQGDEPLIEPGAIDAAVEALLGDPAARVATLCTPLRVGEEVMDPNVVKVVLDFQSDALYFSRAPIPWVRDAGSLSAPVHFKHIGLYVYRREALLEFPTMPPGELERVEQLEQLRWLENGWKIRVVETDYDAISVDVPADVSRIEARLRPSSVAE
jgi:3-deoxy-manno-octulosonate cytidylyltransferase (CMP-KDO synthetase)